MFQVIKGLANRVIATVDDLLCRNQDARATEYGWRIEHTGIGKRRYRDPRFDALTECRDCLGTGNDADRAELPCVTCEGTGVVDATRRTAFVGRWS